MYRYLPHYHMPENMSNTFIKCILLLYLYINKMNIIIYPITI